MHKTETSHAHKIMIESLCLLLATFVSLPALYCAQVVLSVRSGTVHRECTLIHSPSIVLYLWSWANHPQDTRVDLLPFSIYCKYHLSSIDLMQYNMYELLHAASRPHWIITWTNLITLLVDDTKLVCVGNFVFIKLLYHLVDLYYTIDRQHWDIHYALIHCNCTFFSPTYIRTRTSTCTHVCACTNVYLGV